MERNTRIVIIGAGIVGCSLAEELTSLGCENVLVLDQGPLFRPGGSTSHAPGGVLQMNFSRTITQFAQYTVRRYCELELDGEPVFYQVGSLEVATTEERWEDLKRRHGAATSWGVPSEMLSPEQCEARIPLLDGSKIRGGLFVPTDGAARPSAAAEALARLAVSRGAIFRGDTEVTGIEVRHGHVTGVDTAEAFIPADVVVSCAGIWGPRIGRMVGVSIPLVPMQHLFAWTTPIPELAGETRESAFPTMRHQGRDLYFRHQRDRYGVGTYEHRPLPIAADDLLSPQDAEVMPSVLPFTSEDFAPSWEVTAELLPAIGRAELADPFNGVFSFTTDGFPLLGESRQVRGFWMAEAVWITHAAGVARSVAEWMVTGRSHIDLRQCDIQRFEPFALSSSYVMERSCQAYIQVYDVIHPVECMDQPRPLRVSPFYARERELGAFFLEAVGWERPQWYESNASLVDGRAIPPRDEWAGRFWSPIVGAEHLATRERVALYDMQSLSKVEVTGPGAVAFLQRLTTGNMDRSVGSVTYTLMLDEAAGIKSDITVARLGKERFQIGCNGPRDVDYFERNLPAEGSVQIRNLTGGLCCVGVWGPRARDLVQSLSDADFSETGHPFFRARDVYIREVPVTAMRLSYVGELGWEIYTTADLGQRLWDLLWEAGQSLGVIAGGRGAYDSLRLEKGYRFYGRDMWTEHDPYEAGLGFTVNLEKGDFVGRDALLRRREEGPRQVLVPLTLDDQGDVVMGTEPVYAGDEPVGFVTSAAYGYSIGRGIAYAWLPPGHAEPDTSLAIEYFGRRLPATVQREPLFDPLMERMRQRPVRTDQARPSAQLIST
ncbi:MAG TPA: FAD-dependent oxidoreductase [Chloroflexota bacterium]|nr:FAD-dependent oxidoreductase [Chloroflexota bacterium]